VQTLRAPDGTTIAYEETGSGPALILVMGALCDRLTTTTLSATLSADFTVYAYDRRGRGASSGAAAGSVDLEVDDLAALVEQAGGSPFVFGHSSGGALALEAAARGVPMAGLVVYEPPYTAEEGATEGSTELLDRVRACLAADDRDGALDAFLAATGAPPEALAGMKHSPYWPRMRDLAPTLVNDIALTGDGRVPSERMAGITVPTVAAYGGASGGWAARSSAGVCAAIPGARPLELEGQNHNLPDDVLAPLLRKEFAA
jgi:pimeloyl-ACP methyl ester carboxylesterase